MSRRNYIEKKNKQNQPDKQMKMLLEDAKAEEEKKRKKKRDEEMMKWKNRRRHTRIEKHMTKLAEVRKIEIVILDLLLRVFF